MDRVLKLIYNERYFVNGYEDILLNGIHPAIAKYIKNNYTGTNIPRDAITDKIQSVNTNRSWSSFFRGGNFLGYYTKHFSRTNIIKIEDIKDDDSIYLFPIDIGGTTDDIYNQHVLHLDGTDYSYHFIDTIDPIILNHIKTGKVKLIFNCIHDPISACYSVRNAETYLNDNGINSSNIFFIFGNQYDTYFKEYPDSKLNLTNGCLPIGQAGEKLDEYPMVTALGYVSDIVRETDLDINQIRNKKFLCFNRNLKHHRYFLAYLALKFNLLDNSYFSFLVHSGGGIDSVRNALNYYQNILKKDRLTSLSSDNIIDYVQQIYDMVPYQLDTYNLPIEQLNGFTTNNNKKDFYLNSYIHITSETSFSDGDRKHPFFSEKTFHPIINLQPFIYVGNPYSLKTLQELGFKTFHPFINESYDTEEDPTIRMALIEKEIERFSNMSLEEIHNLYYSLTDILIHNQTHCKTYKKVNPFETTINRIINHGN